MSQDNPGPPPAQTRPILIYRGGVLVARADRVDNVIYAWPTIAPNRTAAWRKLRCTLVWLREIWISQLVTDEAAFLETLDVFEGAVIAYIDAHLP